MKAATLFTVIIAICSAHIASATPLTDSAGLYVNENYAMQANNNTIIFTEKDITTAGDYAVINSNVFFADGSPTDGIIEDLAFVLCLKKTSHWMVVFDLSRGDVPSQEEIVDLKQKFPKDFPLAILPPYWQKILSQGTIN